MGKGVYKVTKKNWYYLDENKEKKYEIFKNQQLEVDSYYFLENRERKYINDDELLKKYIENNKKLKSRYEVNESGVIQLFGKVSAYKLYGDTFKKEEIIGEETGILFRKFSKDRVEGKKVEEKKGEGKGKKLPQPYEGILSIIAKKNDGERSVSKEYSKDAGGNFYFYQMIEQEKKLTVNRAHFTVELERSIGKIIKKIEENKYKYNEILLKEEIEKLVGKVECYNHNKKNINKGSIDLIDELSENTVLDLKGAHKQLIKILINYLKNDDRDKSKLLVEIHKYFYVQCKLLANKLGIYQKLEKNAMRVSVENVKDLGIEGIKKGIKKACDNYRLENLLKKISVNKEIKGQKELIIFNTIKEHYNNTFEKWNIKSTEEQYYIKYIHRYMLGRAKKVKQIIKLSETDSKKDNGVIYPEKLKEIFNQKELEKKIFNSIKNKVVMAKEKAKVMTEYDLDSKTESKNPVLKVVNTLKLKLVKSAYEAIVTGIGEVNDQSGESKVYGEIYGAFTLGDIDKKIKEYNVSTDKKDELKWAYLLRNFSFHYQEFNTLDNKNQNQIEELLKNFKGNRDDRKIKGILVEYEMKKIESNNCINFIVEEKLKELLELINLNEEKPNYLPRFSKIYKKIKSKINGEEIEEEREEKEQSEFYFFSLLYSHGFKYLYKELTDKWQLEEDIDEKEKLRKEKIARYISKINEMGGFSEFKQREVISRQGEADKIRKFEMDYIELVGEVFLKIIEKNNFHVGLLREVKLEGIEAINNLKNSIKKTIEDKVEVPENKLKLLFSKSILKTSTLAKIEVKSELTQTLKRYVTLITSLKEKYGVEDVNKNLEKIFKKDNILLEKENLEVLESDFQNLIRLLECEIKLESSKFEFNTEEAYLGDFQNQVVRAYNLDDGESIKIEDISYTRETESQEKRQKVSVFASEKVEGSEERLIVPNTFFRNECNQRTLSYMIDTHIKAMKDIKLNYNTVLETISCYNEILDEKSLETDKTKNLIEILFKREKIENTLNEFKEKTKIQYFMAMRREIQKYFKEQAKKEDKDKKRSLYPEYFKKNKDEEDFKLLAKSLKTFNNRINKYNFYKRLMNLNQLANNKRIYRDYFNRMVIWAVQGEKTGIILGGENKEKSFEFLENYQSERIQDTSIKLRNDVTHLNIYHSKTKGIESVEELYNKFEKFNSYHVKKRNEGRLIESKILENHNILRNNQNKYSSKVNSTYSIKNEFCHDIENICEQEVNYIKHLLRVKNMKV